MCDTCAFVWAHTCYSACVAVSGPPVGAGAPLPPWGSGLKKKGNSDLFVEYLIIVSREVTDIVVRPGKNPAVWQDVSTSSVLD